MLLARLQAEGKQARIDDPNEEAHSEDGFKETSISTQKTIYDEFEGEGDIFSLD